MAVHITKSFAGKDTATLMTALEDEKTDNKLDAVSITRTSDFTGALADYVVIFQKARL